MKKYTVTLRESATIAGPREPVVFEALSGKPVDCFFTFATPNGGFRKFLREDVVSIQAEPLPTSPAELEERIAELQETVGDQQKTLEALRLQLAEAQSNAGAVRAACKEHRELRWGAAGRLARTILEIL